MTDGGSAITDVALNNQCYGANGSGKHSLNVLTKTTFTKITLSEIMRFLRVSLCKLTIVLIYQLDCLVNIILL